MNTIIFDMGMVLVDFRWRAMLSDLNYEKTQIEQIGEAVFKNPLWQQFDWGIMGDTAVVAKMKEEAPEHTNDIDTIWANFKEVCHPFSYAEELVKTLHDMGYKIYILSNYGRTLLDLQRESFTFLNHVDGGVISCDVKQMKPHEDIYETLMSKYGFAPEDAVFFDDHKDNCEAARRLGLKAVEVHGLETILEGLKMYYNVDLEEIRKKYL